MVARAPLLGTYKSSASLVFQQGTHHISPTLPFTLSIPLLHSTLHPETQNHKPGHNHGHLGPPSRDHWHDHHLSAFPGWSPDLQRPGSPRDSSHDPCTLKN